MISFADDDNVIRMNKNLAEVIEDIEVLFLGTIVLIYGNLIYLKN